MFDKDPRGTVLAIPLSGGWFGSAYGTSPAYARRACAWICLVALMLPVAPKHAVAGESDCIAIGDISLVCIPGSIPATFAYQVTVMNTSSLSFEFGFWLGNATLPPLVSVSPNAYEGLSLAPGASTTLLTNIVGATPGEQFCLQLVLHDATLSDCCGVELCLDIPSCDPGFIRGDCNASGGFFNLSDVIFELNYLFLSGPTPPCFDACDLNDDGNISLVDVIYELNFLFLSGPAPPPPFPNCGSDPTADALSCTSFPPCP